MTTMRLQPVGLPETEVTRLEVFLRFVGKTTRGQWVLVRDGAAELLICAATARRLIPSHSMSEVAVLPEPGEPQNVLARDIALPPVLDLEALQALLMTVESRMAVADALPATAPVSPLPAAPSGPALEGRFRLIRWPGADLLRSHPKAVRLLGLLARESLDMDRLQTLSGLDRAACAEIVQQLLRRDLLAWHGCPAASGAPVKRPASRGAPEAAGAGERTTASGELHLGLLTRLRRKLGLS